MLCDGKKVGDGSRPYSGRRRWIMVGVSICPTSHDSGITSPFLSLLYPSPSLKPLHPFLSFTSFIQYFLYLFPRTPLQHLLPRLYFPSTYPASPLLLLLPIPPSPHFVPLPKRRYPFVPPPFAPSCYLSIHRFSYFPSSLFFWFPAVFLLHFFVPLPSPYPFPFLPPSPFHSIFFPVSSPI